MRNTTHTPDLKHLAKFQIFQGLPDDKIRLYIEKFNYYTAGEGDIIIKEGDPGDSIYLLLKGEVEVTQALTFLMTRAPIPDTREKAIIRLNHKMHPFFGEMSLFAEEDTRTANIRAVTECVLARISKEDFFTVTHENPGIGLTVTENIARVLVERLKNTNNDVTKLTTALALILEQ
ncbi:MAG: cyclic nucleotide-binding domain-containing protein [Candidatus Marinimicrobia bacterium]|nr:cyclic nucleotide-binding domain-containing protein [Candidatus Neomarinimicrobiota bacterium]MCF7828442.1 cyclic nucleotide-binding domain-containing protein [Candidatus Neomarinimicrobiota bacterium]MCF7880964.1 cyclic nucleotide-binding domain-containing protein [Candidatus Neomarinimicrobiota bacterium]